MLCLVWSQVKEQVKREANLAIFKLNSHVGKKRQKHSLLNEQCDVTLKLLYAYTKLGIRSAE